MKYFLMNEIALHEACLDGNILEIERLLDTGVKINAQDVYGESALHKAIDCRHPENEVRKKVIQVLCERGIDTELKTKGEVTALHLSAESGFVWAVEYLLDKGANMSCENDEGSRPIHLAAWSGHYGVLSVLLDRGASVDEKNNILVTPLHFAARSASFNAFSLLIKRGADVGSRDIKERSVLHFAAKGGSVDIVKLLLERGFSLDDRDVEGNSALHFSAKENHWELTEFILESYDLVDCRNSDMSTPLILSVSPIIKKRDVRTTKCLLAKKASVTSSDKKGWTALHYACFVRSYDAVALILRHHPEIDAVNHKVFTPLHLVVNKKKGDGIMKLLLDSDADVNCRDFVGRTPLHLALEARKPKYVASLLTYGADITIRDFDYYETPLDMVNGTDFDRLIFTELRWMLLEHVYKLQALDLLGPTHYSDILLTCDNSQFYGKCVKEVAKLKERTIAGGVSVLDILTSTLDKGVTLCRTCIMSDAIDIAKLNTDFPIYGSMLQVKFKKIFEKTRLLNMSQSFFSIVAGDKVPNLNEDCIQIILSYLCYRDLKVLAECCD